VSLRSVHAGQQHALVLASRSAPRATSSRTHSMWPLCAAVCSSVVPLCARHGGAACVQSARQGAEACRGAMRCAPALLWSRPRQAPPKAACTRHGPFPRR
jgi:hypothetical protein